MTDIHTITDESIVKFHTLYKGEEEDGLVPVGRQDIASYVSLPVEAVEVIDLLDSGASVGEVKSILEKKYGEEVEIEDFIQDMISHEMVQYINGTEIPTTSPVQKRLFTGITSKHVSWLFSKYAWYLYMGTAVASLAIFAFFPQYLPEPQDLFFHPWYSVAIIFVVFFSWVLVAIHELAHLFAAKTVGIEGNFSLSNRLIFLVVQTNLGNIWVVPRKNRYIVYLAGIAWDTVTVFISLVVLLLSDQGYINVSTLLYNFLKTIIFIKVWAIIWQFRFNMQTDIYYVVSNYWKCGNLLSDAQTYIKNGLSRVWHRFTPVDMSSTPESEMRTIKMYAPLYFFGTFVTLATFFMRTLPIVLLQILRAFEGLTVGYTADAGAFTDAVVLIALNILRYGLLGYVMLRPRWQSLKQRISAMVS